MKLKICFSFEPVPNAIFDLTESPNLVPIIDTRSSNWSENKKVERGHFLKEIPFSKILQDLLSRLAN
jgi:hypothetical protein